MLKEYKFGFNIYGLLLFLIIMIPNFIWFAVPAPNDVLRAESVTEVIDIIASVCQVLMVIALRVFVNVESHKFHITSLIIFAIICCLIYFASMDYRIRQIRENEYCILSDFLYKAIFIPEGMEKSPKSIIEFIG